MAYMKRAESARADSATAARRGATAAAVARRAASHMRAKVMVVE